MVEGARKLRRICSITEIYFYLIYFDLFIQMETNDQLNVFTKICNKEYMRVCLLNISQYRSFSYQTIYMFLK